MGWQDAPIVGTAPATPAWQSAPLVEPPLADPYAPPDAVPIRDPLNPDAPPTMGETTFAEPAERQLTHPEMWQLISQAGLRGAADLAGVPYDLPNAIFMGSQWVANKLDQGSALLGNRIGTSHRAVPESVSPTGIFEALDTVTGLSPPEGTPPFNLSDAIADFAASEVDPLLPALPGFERVPPMTREDMGSAEELYDPLRFAAGSGLGGVGLATKASHSPLARTGRHTTQDRVLDPYRVEPGTAIGRDMSAGFGAGIGVDMAEDMELDGGLGALLAPLLGALGGSAMFGLGRGVVKQGADVFDNISEGSQRVGDEVFSPAQVQEARRRLQGATKDPLTGEVKAGEIASKIREKDAYFTDAGLSVPDAGVLAGQDYVPFANLGKSFRLKYEDEFSQSDRNIKNAASSQISGLKDSDADLSAVHRSLDATERSYQMSRDAEALPLLQAAEASGAAVDAATVAALIDKKLMTAKRPPVRKALAEARAFLNTVGGEELDTSVSGLYEARKAINDVIEGRGENPTGRFAQKELIEVREALDAEITRVSPEFGEYLQRYREGSAPLDDFARGTVAADVRGVNDVHKFVEKTLNDVWGGKATMQELRSLISGDPEADRAVAAATSDVIARRVTGVTKGADGEFQTEAAKLSRALKDYEDTLAEVYSPEQMNTLRQGQALLETLQNIPKGSVAGSQTASNWQRILVSPAVEASLKLKYGMLKGGGILRGLRVLADSLPTGERSIEQLMLRAFLDPDLMADLLEGRVRDIPFGAGNKQTRLLQSGFVASQDDNPPEEE